MHMHMHTYIHTYIHTYVCIYVYLRLVLVEDEAGVGPAETERV